MVYDTWQNKHWWKEGNLVECTLFISKERAFPGGSDSKESACITEDWGLILGLRWSPGQGIGYPLQYSCLENSMDRSLAGYSPWGRKELDMTERLKMKKKICVSMCLFIYLFVYISAGNSRILHDNILKYSFRPSFLVCFSLKEKNLNQGMRILPLSLFLSLLLVPSERGQTYHGVFNFKRHLIFIYNWHFVNLGV